MILFKLNIWSFGCYRKHFIAIHSDSSVFNWGEAVKCKSYTNMGRASLHIRQNTAWNEGRFQFATQISRGFSFFQLSMPCPAANTKDWTVRTSKMHQESSWVHRYREKWACRGWTGLVPSSTLGLGTLPCAVFYLLFLHCIRGEIFTLSHGD